MFLQKTLGADLSVKAPYQYDESEFSAWAKAKIEDLVKRTGLEIKPTAIQYRKNKYSKFADVYYRGRKLGTLSADHGMKKPYKFDANVELPEAFLKSDFHRPVDAKSTLVTEANLIKLLKSLKGQLGSQKLGLLKGDKPSNWATPPLKKAQQKSLLHLVKSKYVVIESR